MIEGLKLDVSAAELTERLSGLIVWHRSRAGGCALRLQRLAEIQNDVKSIDADLDALGWDGGYNRLSEALEWKRTHHLERASVLEFLRDHLVAGEIYRLEVEDLRWAGLMPRNASHEANRLYVHQ